MFGREWASVPLCRGASSQSCTSTRWQLLITGSWLQASVNFLVMEDQLAGNRLVHLLPLHGKSMFGVNEDAWSSLDMVRTCMGGPWRWSPLRANPVADVLEALSRVLKPEDRHHVRWLVVDNASPSLLLLHRGSSKISLDWPWTSCISRWNTIPPAVNAQAGHTPQASDA